MLSTSSKRVSGGGEESKHFTSLQIFTSYAEPPLNEYLDTEEQVQLCLHNTGVSNTPRMSCQCWHC